MKRLASYENTYPTKNSALSAPLPILYPNNTPVQAFYRYMLTFMPELDSHNVYKIFTTIQKLKLEFFNHLRRTNILDTEKSFPWNLPPKLPPAPLIPSAKSLLKNEDSITSTSIWSVLSSTLSINQSTTTTLPPVAADDKELLKEIEQLANIRKKRNIFSDILASATGLSTQSQMDSVMEFEKSLKLQEDHTSSRVLNITKSTDMLLQNVQNISSDLSKILKDESNMLSDVHYLIANQSAIGEKFTLLLDTLAASTTYQAKFANIILELNILQASIYKIENVLQSIISGIVDVTIIDANTLYTLLGTNTLKSLSTSASHLTYDPNSDTYIINYVIDSLSPPYSIYRIQTIPVYMDNTAYDLNVMDLVATNPVADIIYLTPILNQCTQQSFDYICKQSSVIILHNNSYCELELIQSYLKPDIMNFPTCVDKFRPTVPAHTQSYLFKPNYISLTSTITDTANISCNASVIDTIPIKIGSNIIKTINKQSCTLHTSHISIYIPRKMQEIYTTGTLIPDSIMESIADLDQYLLDANNMTYGYLDTQRILKNLSEEHYLLNNDVYSLNNHVKRLLDIRENAQFKPLDIDFTRLDSPSNYLSYIFWGMVIIVICMLLFCCTTCFSTIRSACCIAIWPFQFCCKILGICANFREYYANLPSAPTQNILCQTSETEKQKQWNKNSSTPNNLTYPSSENPQFHLGTNLHQIPY